jgi:hypothetical protein
MKHPPQPAAPGPVRLTALDLGRLPRYVAVDGRFTVDRNPAEPGVPFEDTGYRVLDTARAGILGHGENEVRVYELADARAVIRKVLRVEHADALRRWDDDRRRAEGRPTALAEAEQRARASRARSRRLDEPAVGR